MQAGPWNGLLVLLHPCASYAASHNFSAVLLRHAYMFFSNREVISNVSYAFAVPR